MTNEKKKVILYICATNNCRSQIAEYYTNHLCGDKYIAYSAGTDISKEMDDRCVTVMSEVNINMAGKKTKSIDRFKDVDIDIVITLCGRADASCPIFPGSGVKYHHRFDNPSREAEKVKDKNGSYEEILAPYRRVRDEIKEFVLKLPASLK